MQARDRLVVAVDYSSRDEILRLVEELRDTVGVFKIGLQAFIANGPGIVREIVAGGAKVFLDLKVHDIPNTARHAVAEAAGLGASMITVHAAGGAAMLHACAGTGALVLAVTVLTSLDETELTGIGLIGTPLENTVRLAALAQSSGLRGVVASPLEIRAIRQSCGPSFVILTPGIRAAGDDSGDQRRTMTAAQAVREGADFIVVGRPITRATDRRKAALSLVDEMGRQVASAPPG